MSEPPSSLSILQLSGLQGSVEIPWDSAMAKSRGIFGFDSMDARSRSFNMIRGRLIELQMKRGWRMIGVVSATPNVGKSFISANVSAALSRDPVDVKKTLLSHPLIGRYALAEELLERMAAEALA